MVSFALIFFTMLFPVVPVYAREVLDVDEVQFGWMWGALAIGQGSSALSIAASGGFRNKPVGLIDVQDIVTIKVVG